MPLMPPLFSLIFVHCLSGSSTSAQNKDFSVWNIEVTSMRKARTNRKIRMSLTVFSKRVSPQLHMWRDCEKLKSDARTQYTDSVWIWYHFLACGSSMLVHRGWKKTAQPLVLCFFEPVPLVGLSLVQLSDE